MKFLIVVVLLAFLINVEATFGTFNSFNPANNRIPGCPDYCTELYNPVCAISQSCTALFGNPCKLDDWNCNRLGERFIRADPRQCRFLDASHNIQCR